MNPLSIWQILTAVLMVCGAVVPGPCSFVPDQQWDCSLGDPCAEGFACANDGYCKSADVACADNERLCTYPSLDRVAICVDERDLDTDPAHCGDCFNRCRGAAQCVDGACVDEIPEGRCVLARGHFDCAGGEVCQGAAKDDVEGTCVGATAGAGRVFEGCDSGDDCDGGLCVDQICGRPCDFGCPAFSVCDESAIPGGLCRLDTTDTCAP